MIKLVSSLGTIELPNECIWVDEFEWTGVKAKSFYSISGDFIAEPVYTGKGRPITFGGDNAVIERADLLELLDWTNHLDLTMVLTLHDNRTFDVIFRYWEPPVVEGVMPKIGYANPYVATGRNYYYILSLKLVQV
jgi:hypothetical protein